MGEPHDYFKIKKACPACPFRKSSPGGWLGREFATEIADGIRNQNEHGGSAPFGCHQTTGAVDGRGVMQKQEGEDLSRSCERGECACAGSVATSINECEAGGELAPVFRVGAMLGLLDPSKVDREDTFESFDEFIEHHARADKYPGYSEERGDVPFDPPKGIA